MIESRLAVTEVHITASDLQLAALLRQYAHDLEGEGRLYAPSVMREAARRLEQPK